MGFRKYLIFEEIPQQFNASNSKRPTRKLQSNIYPFNHPRTELTLQFVEVLGNSIS
jgi:hypothetical protein